MIQKHKTFLKLKIFAIIILFLLFEPAQFTVKRQYFLKYGNFVLTMIFNITHIHTYPTYNFTVDINKSNFKTNTQL